MLSISCYSWVKSWRNKNLKIYPACVSKYNSDCKKQVIILMISNKQWWNYLPVKKLLALLNGLTSNNNDHFCFLNCLHSSRTKNKLESHKKVKIKVWKWKCLQFCDAL